ncbi:MAG: Ig-like domain-containing protein, partial [Nitrososphaera sp.]
ILTFFITGNPSHGTLSDFDADSGELTYTPDLGYSGSDSFSFGVNDGDQESNTAMVSIYIGGDNNPPAAYDMFFGIVEDSFLEITLQGSDIDGDDLIFTVVGNPSHGTLDGVAPDLVYVPSANYAGLDYFTFSVNDGSADSIEPGTIEIAIDAVNDPPVAFNKSVSVSKNSLKAITLSATDADGDPLSYTIVSQPEHGTLTSYPPNLSYRADEGYTGSDSLKFVASDAVADSNVATVSITIISKAENDDYDDYYDEDYDDSYYDHYNSAPIANSQNVSGTEDTPLKLKLSATDADDDYPGFEIADYPSHGNLSDFDVELGTLVYRPSAEYSGSDSFTFRAIDNFGESELATVWVSIAAVNDPPKAIGQEFTTSDNKTAITLTAFDAEGDPMNYTILSKPVHGTLTGTAPNFVYGVIDPDFAGEDSFTFIVSDGESDTIGAVLITIVDPTEFSEDTDAVGDHERAGDGASAPSSGPSGHNSNNGNDGASTRIHVEKGNTIVQLSWEHNHQASGAESTLNLQFSDRMTRLPLGGHIWYDLVILDHDNKEIVSKQDLIALNSADIQKVAFPENAVYRIEVIVKGVIDKSNNSVTQDGAYTGRAIGIVVVPEFNSAWLMIVAATVMSSAIVTFRFASKSRR